MDTNNNIQVLLSLEPLDLLLFREGRPFASSTKVSSGLPAPQTIAGALRTAMLRICGIPLEVLGEKIKGKKLADKNTFRDAVIEASRYSEINEEKAAAIGTVCFQGPWFGRIGKEVEEEIFFPLPESLKLVKNEKSGAELVRLYPTLKEDIPGWKEKLSGMKPFLSKINKKFESGRYYLNYEGMSKFLEGGTPTGFIEESEIYGFSDRIGIAIDSNSFAARESMIYSANMLALKHNICILVELSGSSEILSEIFSEERIIAVGGEGRYVRLNKVPEDSNCVKSLKSLRNFVNFDDSLETKLIVLTTPALLNSWHPSKLQLLSAVVSDYEAISGWDMAKNGPKKTRFAVPAGTVYYVKNDSKISSKSTLKLGNECDTDLGWGCYFEGK